MSKENDTIKIDITRKEYFDLQDSIFAKIQENRSKGISDMDDESNRLFQLRYKLQNLWKMFPQ